jgi:hypothetical protein
MKQFNLRIIGIYLKCSFENYRSFHLDYIFYFFDHITFKFLGFILLSFFVEK